MEEILLHACRHHLAYDETAEASRGPWVGKMLVGLPDASRYESAAIESLRHFEPGPYPADRDASHVMGLVRVFAERGSADAAAAIRICEGRLREYNGYDDKEVEPADVVRAPKVEEVISLETILADLESPVKSDRDRWRFRYMGRCVSAADADYLFGLIGGETRPLQLARLLAFFGWWKRPLPRVTPEVIALARHQNDDVREWALRALEHMKDARLRDLALELLREPSPLVDRQLALLVKNGTVADIPLIESRLTKLDDPFEFHHLCCEAVDLLWAPWMTAAGAGIAAWVYEESPCSTCRKGAVNALVELDALPAWMAEEMAFDCDPEIRELV